MNKDKRETSVLLVRILVFFVVVLATHCCDSAQAQNLTPRLLVVDGDSLHAFTEAQARTLARLLTKKTFLQRSVQLYQQLQQEQAAQLTDCQRINELQARELSIREQQLQNTQLVTAAQAQLLRQQAATVARLEQQLRGKGRTIKILKWTIPVAAVAGFILRKL